MELEALQSLLQTPRMQWYLRYGAQARRVARSCEHAGWYLHGALTFWQGNGIEDGLTSLSFVIKLLFDGDELTPALKALLATATSDEEEGPAQKQSAPGSEPALPEEVRDLLEKAQRAVEAADAIPGQLKRYVQNTEQASWLIRAFWAFGRATEQFCASCEEALAQVLTTS